MLPYSIKNVILGIFLSLVVSALHGQAQNQSEADVRAAAEALFTQNNWQEALPLYAQLVSVNPQKPEYNYKFGVCALLGDRTNHRRPIRYLTKAYKTMSDLPEMNFYLGLAYYQNEEFANAMKYFNLYLGKLDANSPQRADILEKVNACLNGMNLEHNNQIAEIIQKNEFQRDNFHRAYRADEFTGMLILKPENFISSQEKKSGTNSYVYISEPRGTLYFSSYENGQATQRDIFKVSLDENGDWGTPEKLPESINSNFDEAYPVMTNNGSTLYFCSKGHSALGGYDIFVSTYDAEKNSFSTPENMGMGINSTFDDVLFIPEKSGDFAWFASNRDNLDNNISVYKVRLNNQNMNDDAVVAQNANPEIKTEPVVAKEVQHTELATNTSTSNKTEQIAPSVKAANKLQARTLAHQKADTAYLLVSQTKTAIRNLTNKRDRANMISQKKEEQAKNLEVQFQDALASLPNATDKENFEQLLSKAIRIKKEIYQFRMRADQANRIAWSIGKHIKIKNNELIELKKKAGEVQTLSVQGNIESTKEAFALMAKNFHLADTLTDYTQNILSITKDEVMFNLPETELAFADNLRQGYANHTLLAAASAKDAKKEVPINIVDNRSQKSAVKPKALALQQIPQMDMVAMNDYDMSVLPVEEYELEINFDVDALTPVPLIAPIEFIAMNEPEENENLEINTQIDAIDAYPLIAAINIETLAFEAPADDPLEINFLTDRITALPLIQEIAFEPMTDASLPENEALDINTTIDAVEALPVIEAIPYQFIAQSTIPADETLDINSTIDAVEALPIIEAIPYQFIAQSTLPVDEALEIRTRTDAINPLDIIAPIAVQNLASTEIPDDENLEINLNEETIAFPLIQPIHAEILAANTLPEEKELEISNTELSISTVPTIAPIEYSEFASILPLDEQLEINIDQETIPAIAQIQPINIAFDSPEVAMDERLEINTGYEAARPHLPLITPIFVEENNASLVFTDETLDISIEEENTTPIQVPDQIETISIPAFAMNEPEMDATLEVNSAMDQLNVVPAIQPIAYPAFASIESGIDDELQISFIIDSNTSSNVLTADNAALTQEDMKDITNDLPKLNTDYYYLRQTMGIANDIETSRSDFDLLRTALESPDDLSYEELLYAANLTPNPEDKLKIYNIAFIHVDRDWRAFNNAAVIALNIKDLDKAECYLYQASLISQDNGNILNNLGILDCYKSDFSSAENHFMAAREEGINTDYNMQVVKEVEQKVDNSEQMLERKMGQSRYFDIIGNNSGLNTDQ